MNIGDIDFEFLADYMSNLEKALDNAHDECYAIYQEGVNDNRVADSEICSLNIRLATAEEFIRLKDMDDAYDEFRHDW